MAANTSIEWTDKTWNCLRGCSVISEGCHNCYAMKMAHRFSGAGKPYEGLTKQTKSGPQWTGEVREVVSALNDPLRWKKPARIFVNSMSDLFHEDVSDEFILNVFTVMAVAKHHTFQVLTKRSDRMERLIASWRADDIYTYWHGYSGEPAEIASWPLPNVQLGVSIENRNHLGRGDDLKDTNAAVRFLSLEPLLEDLGRLNLSRIDWVIVGGESGPGARPFDIGWARNIIRQCRDQNVACFIKQLGASPITDGDAAHPGKFPLDQADAKGGDTTEWPADLRVREFPVVRA